MGGKHRPHGTRRSYASPAGKYLVRRCPKCDAAPGWRCTRVVGEQVFPMVTVHKQRKVG
jgi:hypothetical protein